MKNQEIDPQLRALFTHLRQALDVLEEITSRASLAPEGLPSNEASPKGQQSAPAPILSESKIAY
jgi:hypothetical protein